MSGPKVDIAEVRNQEMKKLAAARESRKNLSDKIHKLINQVNNCIGSDLELMMQDKLLCPNCERILHLQKDCINELQKLLVIIKSGNEMLNIEELTLKSQRLVTELNENVQDEMIMLGQLAKTSQSYQALEENRQQLELAKKKQIVRLTNTDSNSDINVTDEDITELVEIFNSEFSEFMSSVNMTSKHKKSMLLINQDLQELMQSEIPTDRKEKRIKRLFGDFQRMSGLVKTEVEEMEFMYQEYLKECFDLLTSPMQLSEFRSKKEIEEAIIDAKENAENNVSKEYIKRQIDEVMAKHGYDVVRSDMLAEAKQSGQILYGIDKDTAINVFVSDENQVTMRVVGVGFDSNISEAESERLFQQQCAFCSMHPQITAELAMRGVILHTKKHMPPDKKFNKKIQTMLKSDNQTTSRAKKELKRTELKTMHKE